MEFNQRGNGTPESPPNRARPRQHIQTSGADYLGVEEFWKRLARGGSEGRKSPQEIAAFGDGFEGKNWRKSSDALSVIPDYLPTTAVFEKDLIFCKLF